MNSKTLKQYKERFLKSKFNVFPKLSLIGGVFIVILAAGCIVAVAVWMYWTSPNRKYDIARGGETENKALTVQDQTADTTSPVTADSVRQKLDYLSKEIDVLERLNKFSGDDLNDQNIQLLPSDRPSP